MGISKTLKAKFDSICQDDQDRIVRMGWEDRTTFDAIEKQFGISPNELVHFMRTQLNPNAFTLWRRRIREQGQLKNEALRGFKATRFKCKRQSVDGITKGFK